MSPARLRIPFFVPIFVRAYLLRLDSVWAVPRVVGFYFSCRILSCASSLHSRLHHSGPNRCAFPRGSMLSDGEIAVKACKLAGVDVKMITGDNIFTAKAIAFECGILESDDANIDGTVVDGQEFRNFSAQERLEKVGRIRVMARSSPFDKVLMVQCLKLKGHVVAVTGDGTNDAPALKEADVGLAMAIQGTTELMKKPPVGRIEPLITGVMWRNLIAQALFQIIILLALQQKGRSIFGVNERVKNTLIFNTFVLCQIFNEFNARKLEKKNVFEGIHKNWLFLVIVAFTLILQVMMVEVLNRFASTTRLNWGQWNFCCGIAMLSWPIDWVTKCIPVSN